MHHEVDDAIERLPLCVVGPHTRHDFVKQHPQRIHVRDRRHRQAAKLFGTGVVRCERTWHEAGGRFAGVQRALEQLRDAKVEHFWHAVLPDQDVRGLQIAVDDPMLMRVLHGAAQHPEEAEPIGQRQCALVAMAGYRRALDVFHRQVARPSGVAPPSRRVTMLA